MNGFLRVLSLTWYTGIHVNIEMISTVFIITWLCFHLILTQEKLKNVKQTQREHVT